MTNLYDFHEVEEGEKASPTLEEAFPEHRRSPTLQDTGDHEGLCLLLSRNQLQIDSTISLAALTELYGSRNTIARIMLRLWRAGLARRFQDANGRNIHYRVKPTNR